MWSNVGIVWGAASIAFSACLYLLDLGTTIVTLVTYYFYEYYCPHAHPSSALLRRDPICRAVRSDPVLHSLDTMFWACLSLLILAHLIYAFIFWISLHPRDHPFRLAYFMPLIHLYRLLKLLCHSFSFKDLKELQQSQRETNSLYNALGASLETAPQFSIQFVMAMKLGEYIRGSSDPNMQAQRIPTKLIVSLVASMISACCSMSTAVSLLMGSQQMPSATRLCVGLLVGFQTLSTILARTMNVVALSRFSKTGVSTTVLIYMVIGVITSWIFVNFAFQSHIFYHKGGRQIVRIAHSFGLAVMIRIVGPIYLIIKHKKSSSWLIWGVLSHIFGELIGISLVFFWPGLSKELESPCHPLHITSTLVEENKYMTCKVFLGTLFSSLFGIILTTMLLLWITMESRMNVTEIPRTSTDIDIVRNKVASSLIGIYSLEIPKRNPCSK